jgi:putative FmdB family regulatory protein
MPLYEYHCRNCDAMVELLIRGSQERPECPECGSKNLEKELSVAAPPAMSGSLPVASGEKANCGRPQCQSGCMFE